MTLNLKSPSNRPCWFVGAAFAGANDQTERFIHENIWENGYEDKYIDLVKSMKSGDLIAIKSTYVRKHGLPFDNRGHAVSVMKIKAIGTILKNNGDGQRIVVDWVPEFQPREWYFFTYRGTVWRVEPTDWAYEALISFAFEGAKQDIDKFRNRPFWRERFGDDPAAEPRFNWTNFYESLADGLLQFKDDRRDLIKFIHDMHRREVPGASLLTDQYADGTSGLIKDICPFTTFGLFNRGLRDDKRKILPLNWQNFLESIWPYRTHLMPYRY